MIYTCKPSDDYAATYISPNVKEQMGYDPEDFTGNSGFWADHIHPEDKSRIFAQLPRFFEQGRHAHEYRFQFKDGAYRWMRDELKLMRDKDGRPLEIVGYWIDITERKEMETALMKSKAFVSQTEKITKAGGWEYDIVAKKLTWSDEVYRLHGVSKETYDPNSIEQAIQFYAQEDQKILWEAFQAAVERGEPYDLELQFNPADGGKLWVRTIGEVEQKDGRVVRVFGNIMDITDSKKAEEALRQEHAFSDAILESLPGVFYLYDENRRFLRWNRNFTRITGYTDAEMAHRHPLDFFAGPDKELLAERIQEVFTEGGSDAEADFVAKDGTRIPYYFTGLKAMINGKVCLLGVGIDNTKRKKIAAELRKHREHLEKLVKERTAQLEEKLAEIERMNRIFTGREMRMVELKEKIKELEARIGDL